MKTSDVKVIFLDIGGVLLSNGWGHESRQKAAQTFGLNYTEMDVLHHFIFNVYEIDSIRLDEYLDRVVFNHPRDFTKEDFKTFMFAQSTELPDMLQCLKNGKRVAASILFQSIMKVESSMIFALRNLAYISASMRLFLPVK
jgi:putative hydrolase of the HAD superfamily